MNFMLISWVLVILLRKTSSGEIQLENDEKQKKLADISIDVMKNECAYCKTVLVVHSGEEKSCEIFFDDIPVHVAFYTIIVDGNGTTIPDFNDTDNTMIEYFPELTIFFLNTNIVSVEAAIFAIELLPRWNIRGNFMVLIEGEEQQVREAFESFWERQVIRVLICYLDETHLIKAVTFDPFQDLYNLEIKRENFRTMWFNRRITNMYGTPIKLYQFDTILTEAAVRKSLPNGKETWVGNDGMFFSVLAECMNTSLDVHPISEDFDENLIRDADPALPFSQYINLFSEMFDFDLLFNRMQTFSDNTMDHIFLYERNEWRILIPRAGMVPQYLYIVLLVDGEVWAAISVSLLGIIMMRKILGGRNSSPVLDNLAYLLGTSAPHRKYMLSLEKFVLALWALDCVVIGSMFQTTLMSSLVVPKFYKNIDSIQEIYDNGIQVYGPEYTNIQIKRILGDDERQFGEQLLNTPRNVTVYGMNIEWIDYYKHDSGVIISQEQLYELEESDPTLFETNHVIAESVPIAVCYNIPRNKLYFEQVQRVFGTIQEAGLHKHWRDFNYNLKRSDTRNKTVHRSEKEQTLTLVHLQSTFFLLLLGFVISGVVFALEIIWFQNKTKRKPITTMYN